MPLQGQKPLKAEEAKLHNNKEVFYKYITPHKITEILLTNVCLLMKN